MFRNPKKPIFKCNFDNFSQTGGKNESGPEIPENSHLRRRIHHGVHSFIPPADNPALLKPFRKDFFNIGHYPQVDFASKDSGYCGDKLGWIFSRQFFKISVIKFFEILIRNFVIQECILNRLSAFNQFSYVKRQMFKCFSSRQIMFISWINMSINCIIKMFASS